VVVSAPGYGGLLGIVPPALRITFGTQHLGKLAMALNDLNGFYGKSPINIYKLLMIGDGLPWFTHIMVMGMVSAIRCDWVIEESAAGAADDKSCLVACESCE